MSTSDCVRFPHENMPEVDPFIEPPGVSLLEFVSYGRLFVYSGTLLSAITLAPASSFLMLGLMRGLATLSLRPHGLSSAQKATEIDAQTALLTALTFPLHGMAIVWLVTLITAIILARNPYERRYYQPCVWILTGLGVLALIVAIPVLFRIRS